VKGIKKMATKERKEHKEKRMGGEVDGDVYLRLAARMALEPSECIIPHRGDMGRMGHMGCATPSGLRGFGRVTQGRTGGRSNPGLRDASPLGLRNSGSGAPGDSRCRKAQQAVCWGIVSRN